MTEYMISYLPGLFWGIVGCCLGSFLDLWAQRIRREESIFRPRSHCDSCGAVLGPLELIPLVSWLAQKGRCRHCGAELSSSLFWRESACGALFVLVARMPGSPAVLAVRLLCLSLMLVVSWLDMDELQLYEDFFPPLGLLFLILHGLTDGDFLGPVAGAAILWALLALIHWQVPEGMGAGDPKLAAVMGLWLGPVLGLRSFFLAMGMAFLSVAFLGFKTHSRWQEHMAMQVPLAPFFFGAGLLLRSRALLGPVDTGGMPELFCFLGILELDRTKGRYWLSRAGEWIRRHLAPWPGHLLAVQAGARTVTLVQVQRKKGGWEVERFLELAWPERIRRAFSRDQGEEVALWLQEVCAKRGLTASSVLWTLSPDLMEFRNLLLPGLSRKEQAEAASWEILQQIEYPPGTFALGVEAGPETGEDILAAAVPLALLETGETIARQMDWELLRQEAAPAAWGRWMEQEPAAFLLVRDLDRIQGAWYGYGRLLALRNLPLADGEEAMPEETAGLLWDKLPAGIRERFQTGPTGLYLAGGTEEEQQAWKEFFQQQWDCPVRLLEGKAQFQWAPYYTEKQPSGLTSGLCGALGAVLSEGRPSAFCFASGGERGRWLSGISWLDLGKKMAAGTLALLLWGLGARFLCLREETRCREHLRQAAGWESLWTEQQERRKLLVRQEKETRERMKQQVSWGRFLTLLGNQVPSDCWLTRVEQQKEGRTLVLEGRSLKRDGALALVSRLRKQPELAQVKLERMEQEERESDLTGFSLRIRLKGEKAHG